MKKVGEGILKISHRTCGKEQYLHVTHHSATSQSHLKPQILELLVSFIGELYAATADKRSKMLKKLKEC